MFDLDAVVAVTADYVFVPLRPGSALFMYCSGDADCVLADRIEMVPNIGLRHTHFDCSHIHRLVPHVVGYSPPRRLVAVSLLAANVEVNANISV